MKYGNYIGDGDSKTYEAILNLNPHGDDFPVVKSECIGHVEKRMESAPKYQNKREIWRKREIDRRSYKKIDKIIWTGDQKKY